MKEKREGERERAWKDTESSEREEGRREREGMEGHRE